MANPAWSTETLSAVTPVPSAFITYTPSFWVKTIRSPSGEKHGRSTARAAVTALTPDPSAEATATCPSRTKTRRFESADQEAA